MASSNKKSTENSLRIIGGEWRSRRIPFAADTGVRPTADRVRETLFNWLQGITPEAHCLDLFAGSGALAFEALSRGAASVTMVDEDLRVIQQLQQNAALLKTDKAAMKWSDALSFLNEYEPLPKQAKHYDIVFLDPPYRDDIIGECTQRLEKSGWLASTAWIYMECGADQTLTEIPDNWELLHNKKSSQVRYALARRKPQKKS